MTLGYQFAFYQKWKGFDRTNTELHHFKGAGIKRVQHYAAILVVGICAHSAMEITFFQLDPFVDSLRHELFLQTSLFLGFHMDVIKDQFTFWIITDEGTHVDPHQYPQH
jgi:hypothetical protein